MQNQINEKEIEKEIEEERLKSANYKVNRKESYIPINQEDFQKLKKSQIITKAPIKTKQPPNKFNLLFEMLFDDVLLIILSYLSPGEIILFSLTCKQAQLICSNQLLWKQIAIKFQDYFSWNFFYPGYDYNEDYQNIELIGIQFKIQEKNQNDPKQKQIKELSKTNQKIKNYFDNSNSTTIKTGAYSYKANFISIKSERIIYIENLQNPKQEIETKGKIIFWELRKAKEEYLHSKKRITYTFGSIKYLINQLILSMNGIILITTFFILNYYIDSKKEISIPKLFLLSEIGLLITIIWLIYLKTTFFTIQEYYNYLSILFTGLIFLITISLKTSKTFNFIPWLFVLLPPIILFIISIYQLNRSLKYFSSYKFFQIVLLFIFFHLLIVILFTGLKLDGFIQIKYLNLIYFLIIFEIAFFPLYNHHFGRFDFFGYLFYSFLLFIISLMMFLYADGIIKKLWIALIPTHIILIYPYFYSFIFSFLSTFELIQKISRN